MTPALILFAFLYLLNGLIIAVVAALDANLGAKRMPWGIRFLWVLFWPIMIGKMK